MGLFDRVKEMFSRNSGVDTPPVIRLDMAARRAQLDELETALRALAQAMAAEEERMANPGWRGRIEDLRFAANEAARLSHEGFDRADLHDVAAQVRLLYSGGPVPAVYAPYADAHERVVVAVAKLRAGMPGEGVEDTD